MSFVEKLNDLKGKYFIYPESVNELNDSLIAMGKGKKEVILVFGNLVNLFEGELKETNKIQYKEAICNHKNANILRDILPFSKPRRVLGEKRSIGLGDRLGIATPGHIRLFKEYDAYPVFAQQSIRELNLTKRTYEDVLDSVTYSVIRYGYKKGFGADGDHLKKENEIEYALSLGFTMLTLDCSEHIKNGIEELSYEVAINKANLKKELKDLYLNKIIKIEDIELNVSEGELAKCSLIYDEAIEFANYIYHKYIESKDVDFELSIDETMTPTTPIEHYYVANELTRRGVVLKTVAPRFCGEFQKGVDYIGNLVQFEKEMKVHAAIARNFKYKLSIHSGSDKFSTFEIIGKYTRGNFHVKTAGTNWLEAMKVVAIVNPELYRNVHKFALSKFNDATKFYHVTTNINNIPDVDTINDNELVDLFKNNDARQLIHITYGYILTERNEKGEYLFKDKLYDLWDEYKDVYSDNLYKHIGHHLELLYKGFKENDKNGSY